MKWGRKKVMTTCATISFDTTTTQRHLPLISVQQIVYVLMEITVGVKLL
ncbi:MAG: hypothetical protein IPO63_14425 [Bacteroidetes bacterium]|nr:hypothetical protein [Bacteroidota bacterium]